MTTPLSVLVNYLYMFNQTDDTMPSKKQQQSVDEQQTKNDAVVDFVNDDLKTLEDLDLLDVPGVGPTIGKKMKSVDILSVTDLAVLSSEELAEKIGSKDKDVCATYIHSAKNLLISSNILEKDVKDAIDLLEEEKNRERISTGAKSLDGLLMGGLETTCTTEFYGQFGSGKSQICHTAAVIATMPKESGGLDCNVLWFDTESTMRAHRLKQIAEEREFDPTRVLPKIIHFDIYTASHLEFIMKNIGGYLRKYKPRLIIVDSIISLHRAAFMGRGTLADRQQRLNAVLHKLSRVAKVRNIAVIITNQVSSSPDTFFGNPEKPTGGNIIGHGSTYRIGLRKSKGVRIATMIDSPSHPYGAVEMILNEKGIDDVDADKLKKKLAEAEEKENLQQEE